MQEHVQPAVLDEVYPGEPHDIAYLFPVARGVAVGGAFLAHRLGVIGAQHQFDYAMVQKLTAVPAQHDAFVSQCLAQPVIFDRKDIFILFTMIFPAVDRDKIA